MDTLDYGRRFTVDAYRHGPDPSYDRIEVESYLSELHALLEPGSSPSTTVLIEHDDGFSVATRGGEANAVLHLFPQLGSMTLQVFSRRDVLLSDLTRSLTKRFGTGRYESHLSNANKALPKEPSELAKVLAGDRDYARIRLDDRLLAP